MPDIFTVAHRAPIISAGSESGQSLIKLGGMTRFSSFGTPFSCSPTNRWTICCFDPFRPTTELNSLVGANAACWSEGSNPCAN
jgi:hypothetical protein